MYKNSIATTILIMCFQLTIVKGQQLQGDTIAYFHNGEISHDWKNYPTHKIFEGKTVLLQERFDKDRICRQYIRYNDSMFLYTEYYQYPDSSEAYQRAWGIKREGLVRISNQTTGGVIVTFDPETYEEHRSSDTLLLPVDKWTFYYPNGQKEREGQYVNYKRYGDWLFYDAFGNVNKRVVYKNGVAEAIEYVNRIGEKSIEATRAALQHAWLIHPREGERFEPKFKGYKSLQKTDGVSGIGDMYRFKSNGTLEYTKTRLDDVEYKQVADGIAIIRKYEEIKQLHGKWKLLNHHQIEINLENQTELFEIEYISDKLSRWRKVNAGDR